MASILRAAEYVFPGHPDKLCDAIADALVQEAARREKRALCGVEVAVHRTSVFITGRVACREAESLDVAGLVGEVFSSAGYSERWRPAPGELRIETDLCLGPLEKEEAEFRCASDDQSIVTGYAVDLPGTNYLPPEHWLAYRMGRRLEALRSMRPELCLGPDGKVMVLLEIKGSKVRLAVFSASLQQASEGNPVDLHRAVWQTVREELERAAGVLSGLDLRPPEDFTLNGAGGFSVGGPEGDNGLSGKKLVVDGYGPRVPIGGGALSGKDLYKADRAGALIARRLARAVVLTGAARECLTTLAFVPGGREARIVGLRGKGDGQRLDPSRWAALLDLSLQGIGDRYTGRVDLVDVARHGHFTDADRPWEQLHLDPIRSESDRRQESVYTEEKV
jgi:S-adenosylmethionine synthetase